LAGFAGRFRAAAFGLARGFRSAFGSVAGCVSAAGPSGAALAGTRLGRSGTV